LRVEAEAHDLGLFLGFFRFFISKKKRGKKKRKKKKRKEENKRKIDFKEIGFLEWKIVVFFYDFYR
jgi:hypothetical protein